MKKMMIGVLALLAVPYVKSAEDNRDYFAELPADAVDHVKGNLGRLLNLALEEGRDLNFRENRWILRDLIRASVINSEDNTGQVFVVLTNKQLTAIVQQKFFPPSPEEQQKAIADRIKKHTNHVERYNKAIEVAQKEGKQVEVDRLGALRAESVEILHGFGIVME